MSFATLFSRPNSRASFLVVHLARTYSVPAGQQVPKKVWDSVDAAVGVVKSGDVLLSGGFGLCGTPDTLIGALAARGDVRNLTAVSNNAGSGQFGLGKLLHTGQVDKMISSYIGGFTQLCNLLRTNP